MSAIFDGIEYTVTGTAANLTSIIGTGRKFLSIIALRAGAANVGTVYIGKSNVTTAANRLGYLEAKESIAVDMTKSYYSSDDIYIVGTPGDLLHIMIFI
jgi:hypothetical protein